MKMKDLINGLVGLVFLVSVTTIIIGLFALIWAGPEYSDIIGRVIAIALLSCVVSGFYIETFFK